MHTSYSPYTEQALFSFFICLRILEGKTLVEGRLPAVVDSYEGHRSVFSNFNMHRNYLMIDVVKMQILIQSSRVEL